MTLKGNTQDFPLDVVIRLLADTQKTGELALRGEAGAGALGIASGQVVTAVYGDEAPIPALGAIFSMGPAEFEFTPWDQAPDANLEGDLQENLRKAEEHRQWLASVREVIPEDRVRFRLSERAAEQGAVTFTSDRWRVVLAVNGERDVTGIAAHLRIDRDAALGLLAGLVRDGVIETVAPPSPEEMAPPAPSPPAEAETPTAFAPEPLAAPPPQPEAEPAAPPAPEPPAFESPAEPPSQTPPPASSQASEWGAPMPQDWGPPPSPEPAPAEPVPPPMPQDWGPLPAESAPVEPPAPPMPQEWGPPPPAEPEPAVDDRLAALFGSPAPAPSDAAPPAVPPGDRWDAPAPAADAWSAPAADWSTPAPAEAPAPPADDPRLGALFSPPAAEAPPADDPRLGALFTPSAAPPSETPAPPVAPASEWAPPAETPAAPAAPPKKGLFGRFKREETAPEPATSTTLVDRSASTRVGLLAAFSNALLTEYNSGHYGKGHIDDRMPGLLMRVDEQADPIDRPLPVVDDRLDVQALERVSIPEAQAAPYLALLVSTIYADAEKTFGRDKAKRGYKAAMQHVFGGDASALGGPDLAGKLPKV
ncbi:MAG TPA: DUF4388 domain-containing protein [Candidatus Limnocylindria bacterium]|nr:DUF4388 domain-containing protein [Candidatus Limnocylindria bacterium]